MSRGGARPGAGRPRGSGKGRTADAQLNLRISAERKQKLQDYCNRGNTTLTAVANAWIDALEETDVD